MQRSRIPFKREAEKRFPHTVDIPVPRDGLGALLNDMLSWCREHAGEWAQHGHSKPGESGESRRDLARFYFMSAADAAAFSQVWLFDPSPKAK